MAPQKPTLKREDNFQEPNFEGTEIVLDVPPTISIPDFLERMISVARITGQPVTCIFNGHKLLVPGNVMHVDGGESGCKERLLKEYFN